MGVLRNQFLLAQVSLVVLENETVHKRITHRDTVSPIRGRYALINAIQRLTLWSSVSLCGSSGSIYRSVVRGFCGLQRRHSVVAYPGHTRSTNMCFTPVYSKVARECPLVPGHTLTDYIRYNSTIYTKFQMTCNKLLNDNTHNRGIDLLTDLP